MKGAQLPLAVQLRDTASFDSYFPGPNLEAVGALREFSHSLLLYGPVGCGRTHLLQAACRLHGGAYLPLDAVASVGTDILAGYENAPTLFLDDVDTITVNRDWCVALLRLIDRLRIDGRRFALSLNTSPDRAEIALPDLRTRLSQCVIFGLRPLDDAQRGELLRMRAQRRGIDLPDDVVRWLLNTQARDTGSLLDALETLDRGALSAKRRITLPLAQSVLGPAGAHTTPN